MPKLPAYRNQSIDLPCKSIDWFLFDGNSGVQWVNCFPGSEAKQLCHHTIPILEQYKYGAAILHVGINDLLRFDKNSGTLVSICDGIINAGLRHAKILILEKYLHQMWHSFQKLLQIS